MLRHDWNMLQEAVGATYRRFAGSDGTRLYHDAIRAA